MVRRVLAHQVRSLDQHIGRSEGDLGGAHRLDREKGDVPGQRIGRHRFRRVEYAAGSVEGDETHRHAEPMTQFARQVGGGAARRLFAVATLRQHAVAVIDRGAQHASRREILDGVGRGQGHGSSPSGES